MMSGPGSASTSSAWAAAGRSARRRSRRTGSSICPSEDGDVFVVKAGPDVRVAGDQRRGRSRHGDARDLERDGHHARGEAGHCDRAETVTELFEARIMKRTAFIIAVVFVGFSALTAAQRASSDYTQWRGPNRDGGVAAFTAPARLAREAHAEVEGRGRTRVRNAARRRQPDLHVLAHGARTR